MYAVNSVIIGAAVGGTIGSIIFIFICIIAFFCVCYSLTKPSSTRNRHIIVQPQAHTTTTPTATTKTPTATTTTAYPMQPTAPPSTYPTQQHPQAAHATAQSARQDVYPGQQPFPTGGYAAPYSSQQQPVAYPAGGQAPSALYFSDAGQPSAYFPGPQGNLSSYNDPPMVYPAGGQAPPAPYPSEASQPSAYFPGPPGDLSGYKDPPPAYNDFQHQ